MTMVYSVLIEFSHNTECHGQIGAANDGKPAACGKWVPDYSLASNQPACRLDALISAWRHEVEF